MIMVTGIYFDAETRQFSTSYERDLEKRYKHLLAEGFTKDEAVKRLESAIHANRKGGHLANTLLGAGHAAMIKDNHILGKDARKNNTAKTVAHALGATLGHGAVGAYVEYKHKKRKEALDKLRKEGKI